jgi:hypothetical protein
MKSNLRIKGNIIWKLCACIIVGVVIFTISNCVYITGIDQPTTATVGQTLPITVRGKVDHPPILDPQFEIDNYVLAILVPKGWKGAENITVDYTSAKGDGVMKVIDPGAIEPSSKLPWSAAMKKQFALNGNYIDDLEWVVFISDKPYKIVNQEVFPGQFNIKIKNIGADNNDSYVKIGYVLCGSTNGINPVSIGTPYFSVKTGPCLMVTGSTGDVIDFCNPQLTNVDPAKSSDNDFLTFKFDATVQSTILDNSTEVYLSSVAHITDASGATSTVTVEEKSSKTLMKQDGVTQTFSLTFWPKSYYNLTDTQTITSIDYFITDQSGTKKVGYVGSPTVPFVYKFKCL